MKGTKSNSVQNRPEWGIFVYFRIKIRLVTLYSPRKLSRELSSAIQFKKDYLIMMLVTRVTPILIIMFVFSLASFWLIADTADARSRFGGRSFSSSRTYRPPARTPTSPNSTNRNGGFTRGLAGGFMGGALGSMLFGGMGGGLGGSGMGLFQILLIAGVGYFVYKRFFRRPASTDQYRNMAGGEGSFGSSENSSFGAAGKVTEGIALLKRSEPDFDPEYFKEVAQDVFFQVQAGWMRRDMDSYRHLLGEKLAMEYDEHFAELRQKGHINKLENIAVRNVEIVDAGAEANEEFVVVLFTANLLDYTVEEESGAVVEGSNTEPVKFAENWTWARPMGTPNWKLEGLEVVNA